MYEGETLWLLKNHNYYGKSDIECRKQAVKDDLKRLFYWNETTFYFEKEVTKMRRTFNVLDNYNVTYMIRTRPCNSWITSIVQRTI